VWNVKTKVKTEATGIISKSCIYKIPEQYTGKAQNQGTTENSQLNTAHTLRDVLMYKSTKPFNMGDSITCAMNCNYRAASTGLTYNRIWIFRKWDGEAWSGLSWFRAGTGSGHL
jgi:flagellar basal body L-ring protein FlgH